MPKSKGKKLGGGNKVGLLALVVLVIGLAAGVVAVQNRTGLMPSAKGLPNDAETIDLQDNLENMAVPQVGEDDEKYTSTVVVCPEGAPTKKTDCQYWGGDGISAAAENAANGREILVKSGEYALVNGRQIALENKSNIGIVGETGGKVIIKTDPDYSLSVIDIKSTGIPVRNIVVRGLIIRRNPPQQGNLGAVISVSGDVKAKISQNKIYSGTRGITILVMRGAQARIVGNILTSDNNLKRDNWWVENQDQSNLFGAVSVWYNSSAFIARNVIAKNYIGIVLIGKSGQETVIKNNTFVRNGSIEQPNGGNQGTGAHVVMRGGGVFVGGGNGDVRIYNNIFFASGKVIYRFLTPFAHTGQFVENNNLFFPNIGSAEGDRDAFVAPDRTDLVGVNPQFKGKLIDLLGYWQPRKGSPACTAADNGGFIGAFPCVD